MPHDRTNALAAARDGSRVWSGHGRRSAHRARRFRGIAHRISLVAEAGGVGYYDDSKATTPHAATTAIRGFEHVVLIAGGRNKDLDLRRLAEEPAPDPRRRGHRRSGRRSLGGVHGYLSRSSRPDRWTRPSRSPAAMPERAMSCSCRPRAPRSKLDPVLRSRNRSAFAVLLGDVTGIEGLWAAAQDRLSMGWSACGAVIRMRATATLTVWMRTRQRRVMRRSSRN